MTVAYLSRRSALPTGSAEGGGRDEANGGPRDWAEGKRGARWLFTGAEVAVPAVIGRSSPAVGLLPPGSSGSAAAVPCPCVAGAASPR